MTKYAKHGHSPEGKPSLTYNTWRGMIERCTREGLWTFKHYGGRGITVCDEWRTFAGFLADMGERPGKNYSLDRIDTDGPYCKENCRWVTQSEQIKNSSKGRWLEFEGRRINMTDAAAEFGIPYRILVDRLGKLGWDVHKALTTPPIRRGNRGTC